MMAKGFVHLNGVTYELAHPADSGLVDKLVESLKLSQPGTGRYQIDVRVDGARVGLSVRLDGLWSVGGWSDDSLA